MSAAVDVALLRRVRRALGGPARQAPDWRAQEAMAAQAMVLVRVFYGIGLAKIYARWQTLADIPKTWAESIPLWPSLWLDYVPLEQAALGLFLFCFTVGFAVVVLPHNRMLRILAAVVALQIAALENSWGGINHGAHEWVWLSIVLCFLPHGRPQETNARAYRQQVILVFASAGTILLLFYSMSGGYKIWAATNQLLSGEFGGFSPYAMAVTVARRSLQTMNDPPLAAFIVANPLLGWPLFLFTYYIELTALLVAFRPRLLFAWGAALILFHLGTAAFLGIAFTDHVIWNTLFLLAAPHARPIGNWSSVLGDVPIFGPALKVVAPSPARPDKTSPHPAE